MSGEGKIPKPTIVEKLVNGAVEKIKELIVTPKEKVIEESVIPEFTEVEEVVEEAIEPVQYIPKGMRDSYNQMNKKPVVGKSITEVSE